MKSADEKVPEGDLVLELPVHSVPVPVHSVPVPVHSVPFVQKGVPQLGDLPQSSSPREDEAKTQRTEGTERTERAEEQRAGAPEGTEEKSLLYWNSLSF